MSKIHYFQRYSSLENAVTNNTLQLIARIYNYSAVKASELLSELVGDQVDIGIEIVQQRRAQESVPDGCIMQRSFKILIESKVDSGVDGSQLLRHSRSFSNESMKVLFLLTKQRIGKQEQEFSAMISKENCDVIFRSITYEQICQAASALFDSHEVEMIELVNDYIEYCNDQGLVDQSRYLMRMLPCGVSSQLNIKYGIYFHPSDRGYTNHSYVGIYFNKIVRSIWEIDSVFDVEYDGVTLSKNLIQGRDTSDYDDRLIHIIQEAKTHCGYNIETGCRFFCGKPFETKYIKTSSGGIQGARLVNLKEVIGDFSSAADVAERLNGMEWM